MTDTNQPSWKLAFSTDELAIYVDETGRFDPELAVLSEYETARRTTRYKVYRFEIPRMQILENGTLANEYGHEEWFGSRLDGVANFTGESVETLRTALCSASPRERALVYDAIGAYEGFENFDEEPQDLTRSAVANWPELDGKMCIDLSVSDNDDGMVQITCWDSEAARDDQSIMGSRWEFNVDIACTSILDQVGLVAALEADGYEVDSGEYGCPPDTEDFAFWRAKYARLDFHATPEALREILGWDSFAKVSANRRVQDQISVECLDGEEVGEYLQACWDTGSVIDAEKWWSARNP